MIGPEEPSRAGHGTLGQRLLACRLCRSVTYSVFLLILIIESIILVPSALNFEHTELQRLEDKATAAVRAALALDDAQRPDLLAHQVRKLVEQPLFVGLAVRHPDGSELVSAGELASLDVGLDRMLQDPGNRLRHRSGDGNRYDIAWRADMSGEPRLLLARLDSSHVGAELRAFVLRIAGLVLLIVAVVTTGTMIVVYRGVLAPILRLRGSMVAAAADPDVADRHRIGSRPGNELGELFSAHDEMLTRVAESKRTDRLRAEEHARFLAHHDALTGLPNRKFFLEHLQQVLSGTCERGESIEVTVLNLSGFRAVNDGLGQAAGDKVLTEIARRLGEAMGREEFVARLEGDEFGVARAKVRSAVDSARQAERLLARIAEPITVEDKEVRLKGRIGITTTATGCSTPQQMLHEAELALSRIRRDTRVRYQFFSPAMAEEARERQEIEQELRTAVEQRAFHLVYQPKVAIAGSSETLAGCEALIRWPHPHWGQVSPVRFIPVAETTGLISPIGEWALREACRQVRLWSDEGYAPPRVAVNLSAQQFRDPRLLDYVRGALARSDIGPGLLELEITESVAMDDVELSISILTALRGLGLQISIDDFGTGYSSLSYLRKLDVDSIKIDKSFVDHIGRDSNADAICEAIIGLGHTLGKRVVAEGVETPAQLAFLRAKGCHEAQGYLFGKPQPPRELTRRLEPGPRKSDRA